MIFGVIGIIGGIIFGLRAFLALIRNSGTAKVNFLLSFVFFFLFFATSISTGDSDQAEENPKEANANENEKEQDIDNTEDEQNGQTGIFKKVEKNAEKHVEKNNEQEKKTNKKKDDGDKSGEAIPAGTYKVGDEVEPGEYLVVVTDDKVAYMENSEDDSGDVESIIFNDNFFDEDGNAYVTLHDGEYFKMLGMEMYPDDGSFKLEPTDGKFGEGMYKVGKDIEPGEYDVIIDGDFSYFEINENSRHDVFDVIDSKVLKEDTRVKVEDGQYLSLRDAYIQVD